MKRSLVSSLFLSLAVAACGAPQESAERGNGGIAMEGPDADGNFYVVGFSGAAAAGEVVTLVNAEGNRVEVVADEDGSFAGILWSAMNKSVDVQTSSSTASAATASPQKINVNYASRTGLEAVPGLGPTLSQRIINYRNDVGLFAEIEDLAAVHGIGPTSLESLRPWIETKIDVNVATKNQLMVLPSIGAAKANAIIAYRNAHGPFATVSDLLLVLSAADFQAVKPYVKAGIVPVNPGADLVNVNKDGIDRLLTLPGIGEGKAKAIVDYRTNHGVFYVKDDLLSVPGIGPATLAGIRDRVTVGVLDPRVGTFVADGAWHYSVGNDESASSFPAPVLVRFERSLSANELLVTFVGGGYCEGTSDCAPFTLKGTVTSQSAESFRYRLSGYMPADGGNFQVYGDASDEGVVDETGATISFTAVRGDEAYRITLAGYRVLE